MHRQGNSEADGTFNGAIQHTGIAVPALLGIGNHRCLLPLRTEEHVLRADVNAFATGSAFLVIDDWWHG